LTKQLRKEIIAEIDPAIRGRVSGVVSMAFHRNQQICPDINRSTNIDFIES
jgi:hypothetical protein